MGKIRVKTLGKDELEKKQAVDAQRRREAKKQKKAHNESDVEVTVEATAKVDTKKTQTATKTVGANPDDAISTKPQTEVHVEPSDKDFEKSPAESPEKTSDKKIDKKEDKKSSEKKSKKSSKKHERAHLVGKNHKAALKKVDAKKQYSLKEAVKLVKDMTYAKFDETVEVHINLREEGVKGEVALPHGTGQAVRVVIVDDKLLAEIDGGTINFDILIAAPSFMPKLVKYARILGPKGLMPNPKNGTVSDDPQQAAKKFQTGSIRYKSEPKAPLLHQAVGKVSFKEEQLLQNVEALVKAVGTKNITDVYISATMTPSVWIDVAGL